MFKKTLCLIALLPWTLYAGSKSQSAIKAFNDGVALVNTSDFSNAASHFDDAIAADADFSEAYYLRGVCRYSLKGMDGALLDLSDAIRLKSDFVDAYGLRGLVYYETDQYDQALSDVNVVLARKPDDAQSHLIRGIIELKREDAAGVKADFGAFLKLRPNDAMAPKIRDVLASLNGGASAPAKPKTVRRKVVPPTDDASATAAAEPPPAPVPVSARRAPSVNMRALADKFSRQVLQGNRGPVVGDINARENVRVDDAR
jgi:tetratricopeptide (TPR) repeat protein